MARTRGSPPNAHRGKRRHRQHGQQRRARERLVRPAGDEHEHEQKQHRAERRRDQRERDSRDASSSSTARSTRRRPASKSRGRAMVGEPVPAPARDRRADRDRRLHEEDRLPAERLSEHTAERGAGGGADDRDQHPHPARRRHGASTPRAAQTPRRARQRRRAPGWPASSSISGKRAGQAADQRREPRTPPCRPSPPRLSRRVGAALGGQQRDREHGRVDADHRGNALDGGVKRRQQLRQREHDDRAVGEGERRSRGDRQRAGVARRQSTLTPQGCRSHESGIAGGRPWQAGEPRQGPTLPMACALRVLVNLALEVRSDARAIDAGLLHQLAATLGLAKLLLPPAFLAAQLATPARPGPPGRSGTAALPGHTHRTPCAQTAGARPAESDRSRPTAPPAHRPRPAPPVLPPHRSHASTQAAAPRSAARSTSPTAPQDANRRTPPPAPRSDRPRPAPRAQTLWRSGCRDVEGWSAPPAQVAGVNARVEFYGLDAAPHNLREECLDG